MLRPIAFLLLLLATASAFAESAVDIDKRVTHGYADNNGVKIHYAALGDKTKPLVIMIHGFPDFWYSWRDQMQALSKDYYVVAYDQRGYNLSDKPKGVENYDLSLLVADTIAVIKSQGRDKAIVVGHDWGGVVSWAVAMNAPQFVDKLVILNLPHPRGMAHERATNPEQVKNSQYARNFQQDGAHLRLTPEMLAMLVARNDAVVRAKYVEAFKNSDLEAMTNYYKRNYPREPYTEDTSPLVKVKMPVLMIHGLNDTALMSGALNNTWDWLEKDLTLVTVPGAGHFVQHDASDLVTRSIKMWLAR